MKTWVLSLSFAWIAIAVFASEGLALRCGMSLVSKGDRKIEVLRTCGAPDFVEKWREKRILPDDGGFRSRHFEIIRIEAWTYNFGASQLIQFLSFHNGKLFEIESGGYGFSRELLQNSKNPRCAKILGIGDKKIDVLRKCGPPSFKEIIPDALSENEAYTHEEEWTYNFGSNSFLYFVGFKNSEVVRIEHGDYGF